jgi:hypothetical protein
MNRSICLLLAFALGLFIFTSSHASEVTIPNTFTSGTTAVAAEVNANFTAVKDAVDDNDAAITENSEAIDTNTAAIAGVMATQAPTWHQLLTTDRFELVMNDEAVLDKETGLVWDRSPDTDTRKWTYAVDHCHKREVGGRFGWRLPTVEELSTLIDNTNSAPTLPTDHPFTDIQSARYWTDTPTSWFADYYITVNFSNGSLNDDDDEELYDSWCVRGWR